MGRSTVNPTSPKLPTYLLKGITPLVSVVLLALFTACQPFHAPLTHSTPYFTKSGQFDGGINFGMVSANANVAYTPVKYLAVQANGYVYNPLNYNNRFFTNYFEVATGFYLPKNKTVYGLNGGYGYGVSNWNFVPLVSTTGSTANNSLVRARYDSKKYFCQFYLSHRPNVQRNLFFGASMKYNLFMQKYYNARTAAHEINVNGLNQERNLSSNELNFFIKWQLGGNLYADFSTGLMGSQDFVHANLIMRFGISVKLGKKD